MDMRRVLEMSEAIRMLALIRHAPQTGKSLAEAFDGELSTFMEIAEALWSVKLLQGDVADGCCKDPCGSSCVVACRMDRRRSLTRKGILTLNRRTKE